MQEVYTEPWGTPAYTGSGRYFYRGSWKRRVKELGGRRGWYHGREGGQRWQYCWDVKVDMHRKTTIVFIDSLLWTLMRPFLWCGGGKKQVGVGCGQCMREGYGSKSTDSSIAFAGNIECCLTWMGIFFNYRIKIAKHQIFLCTPRRGAHTSVTDDLLLWKGVSFLVIEYILERWLIKSTVIFASCWLTCKQSCRPTTGWSVMQFLISVTAEFQKGEINLPRKGPVWAGESLWSRAGLDLRIMAPSPDSAFDQSDLWLWGSPLPLVFSFFICKMRAWLWMIPKGPSISEIPRVCFFRLKL